MYVVLQHHDEATAMTMLGLFLDAYRADKQRVLPGTVLSSTAVIWRWIVFGTPVGAWSCASLLQSRTRAAASCPAHSPVVVASNSSIAIEAVRSESPLCTPSSGVSRNSYDCDTCALITPPSLVIGPHPTRPSNLGAEPFWLRPFGFSLQQDALALWRSRRVSVAEGHGLG